MPSLSEFTSNYSGAKLSLVSYELTCLNKLPLGVLQIKLRFLHDGGSITDPKTQKTRNYPMQPHSKFILIEFNGVPVCSSINSSLYTFFGETTLSVPISIEALHFIEEKRRDDLNLSAKFEFWYKEDVPNQIEYQEHSGSLHFEIKLSASEWLKILKELKYSNRMLIEIDTPNIDLPGMKGFDEVLKKIEQANTKLFKGESPEDILSDLRSAWDLVDKYISDYNKEINKLIKGKSKEEKTQPTKEERIEKIHKAMLSYLGSISDLKESIDKFTQIGPHREIYHSTMEDAELAFRLTTPLIAYYSKLLSKISTDS